MKNSVHFDSGTPAGGRSDDATQLDLWVPEGQGRGKGRRPRWLVRERTIDPCQLVLEVGRRESGREGQGRGERA